MKNPSIPITEPGNAQAAAILSEVVPDRAAAAGIRVLHLGSPNGIFGAERWILALLRFLPRNQIRSIVGVIQDVPGAPPAPLLQIAAQKGFECASFPAPGKLSLAAVGQLRTFIREQGVQIVHTHFYKTTIVGALAVRGTGCRLLVTPHGWNAGGGWKLQAYEWCERLAFAAASCVAPLSADLARGLLRLPWVRGKLTMIPNGVDLDEVGASLDVNEDVRQARQQGAFVVGYIGQLVRRKRIDTLIEAFAALRVDRRRLFVVGDGPERARLEALATALGVADQVMFTGFRDDRLDFLRGFDVFVLPSEQEGIPRCLMEAGAAEIAMVTSDIPGSTDVVRHEQTGLCFPLGDAASLASGLARLQSDPGLRSRLARRARDRVNHEFSAVSMAGRYLALYDRLTRSRQPAAAGREPQQG